MKNFKTLLFCVSSLSFALILISLPCGAQTESLTVRDAVQRALSRNPAISFQKERLQESEQQYSQAISAVFPTLSASVSALDRKDANAANPLFGGNPYHVYDVRLSLNQPIYTGGALSGGWEVTRKEKVIRSLDVEIAERDLTLGVINAFYLVLVNQRKAAVLEGTRAVEKEALSVAEKRQRTGRGQLLDVLQIKTQLSVLESQIVQNQSDLDIAVAALVQLLNDPESRTIDLRGSMDPEKLKALEASVKTEKFRVPEFERSMNLVLQSRGQTELTLAKHWPTLSLGGYVDRSTFKQVDLLNRHVQSWNVGLQLTVPLFSGLSYFSERNAMAAREAQAQSQEEQVRLQFAFREAKALKELSAAHAVIEASRTAFGLARESVKEAQKNFRLATIDYLQFLTVQQNFLNAEIAKNQAEYSYIQALSNYMVSAGHPLTKLVEALQGAGGSP